MSSVGSLIIAMSLLLRMFCKEKQIYLFIQREFQRDSLINGFLRSFELFVSMYFMFTIASLDLPKQFIIFFDRHVFALY